MLKQKILLGCYLFLSACGGGGGGGSSAVETLSIYDEQGLYVASIDNRRFLLALDVSEYFVINEPNSTSDSTFPFYTSSDDGEIEYGNYRINEIRKVGGEYTVPLINKGRGDNTDSMLSNVVSHSNSQDDKWVTATFDGSNIRFSPIETAGREDKKVSGKFDYNAILYDTDGDVILNVSGVLGVADVTPLTYDTLTLSYIEQVYGATNRSLASGGEGDDSYCTNRASEVLEISFNIDNAEWAICHEQKFFTFELGSYFDTDKDGNEGEVYLVGWDRDGEEKNVMAIKLTQLQD